mgnify:CR=1 FL=1
MVKINPDEFYSAIQVQKLAGIKSRQTVIKYIKEGSLNAIIVKGDDRDGGGTRYAIKGEWIESFLTRLKKGLVKGEKYTIRELKTVLNGAIEYCIRNEITTLQELITSVRRLK